MMRVSFQMKTAQYLPFAALTFLFMLLPRPSTAATGRVTEDFDANWLFSKGNFGSAMMPAFDDSAWQRVNVPHDWSSDGPFTDDYGSGNGYAPGGIAWYRKHFQLTTNQAGATVAVEFDGVYDYSEVWINGQFVGERPYGYSSFQYDLTPFVKFAGDNVIAVRVDHSRFADSRYYTGSGIYRNVRLVITDPVHITQWGVFVTTPEVNKNSATVQINTWIDNNSATDARFTANTEIYELNAQGEKVGGPVAWQGHKQSFIRIAAGSTSTGQSAVVKIVNPKLWSLETPNLYKAVTTVGCNGRGSVDIVETTFGIREFHFDADTGFWLNGKNLKIKGVCLHHDAGSIGAAVPDKVLERRLVTLKEIGVNAIRTSHNPPDPGLLDFCDRMGFLVMDEAFDEWTPMKNKWVTGRNDGTPTHFGYGEVFAQWGVTDLQDMIRRDRNHPSIILWSIGNEIDYANDPFSDPVLGREFRPQNPSAKNMVTLARPLIAAVKSLDRTRPVTAAMATVSMSDAVGLAALLDADGYNYQEPRYAADHKKYPHRILYGSENSHQYGAWLAVKTNAFISGQFLWTGADYLGEAGLYPNRASGAGLLDLCSFKKPLAWFRQSLWSDKPMVYLCASGGGGFGGGFGGRRGFGGVESWNWPTNSTVTVNCYANCAEVELSLNGKAIGVKKSTEATNGVLRWQVPFEAGTLKAVGRANGQDVCNYELKTAGPASRIELLPDTTALRANAKDAGQIEFRIVDDNGVRVPNAAPPVTFALTGPARLLGIGNGDTSSTEDCKTPTHHAFQGRGLAILQTTTAPGEITLQASAPGLAPASLTLQSR